MVASTYCGVLVKRAGMNLNRVFNSRAVRFGAPSYIALFIPKVVPRTRAHVAAEPDLGLYPHPPDSVIRARCYLSHPLHEHRPRESVAWSVP